MGKKVAVAEVPSKARTRTLVIVESPAKAKTIKKYLGPGYEVVASKGHVKDLPKRLGIDVENDFRETFEVIESKAKVLAELKAEVKKADRLLLATDPDREGEAIAWHVADRISNRNGGLFGQLDQWGDSRLGSCGSVVPV